MLNFTVARTVPRTLHVLWGKIIVVALHKLFAGADDRSKIVKKDAAHSICD